MLAPFAWSPRPYPVAVSGRPGGSFADPMADKKARDMLSDRDIATHLDEDKVGDLVEAISAAP